MDTRRKTSTNEHLIRQEMNINFKIKIQNLFDVTDADGLTIIREKEYRVFLTAPREPGRWGLMISG